MSSANRDSAKPGRGRPRREGADEEILDVARAMLAERGYRDLTVDGIAERAGVAKTTIYRRWPSKGALIAATIAPPADAADAAALLREVRDLLAPLANAGEDAETLMVARAILSSRRRPLADVLGDPERADELLGALWMKVFA